MSKALLRAATAGLACAAVMPGLPAGAAAAGDAATVEFTIGDVQVIGLNGQSRRATKGLPVGSGDTVDTRSGRVQLRFTDGAYVSLQPQSKFRIDDYRFQGKTDGTERGFFSLLSGGMRTITGLVGRTNKRTYQVTTSVATIGIRGTEYKIAYTNSIEGVVGEGAINVCTGAGCFPFNSGETFMVAAPQTTPQLTQKQVNLPPQPPGNPPGGVFQEANKSTDATPGPYVSVDVVGEDGSPPVVPTAAHTLGAVYAEFGEPSLSSFGFGTVVFDSDGIVTDLDGRLSAAVVDVGGADAYTAWGAFKDVAGVVVHYAVGLPPPGTLPVVATYELKGATAMTDKTGAALGTLNAWSQKVSFSPNQLLDGTATWTLTSAPTSGQRVNAQFSGSPDGPWYISGRCADGSCEGLFARGLPFGPNGSRFGIAYQLDLGNFGTGIGSAVLMQKSTSATPDSSAPGVSLRN